MCLRLIFVNMLALMRPVAANLMQHGEPDGFRLLPQLLPMLSAEALQVPAVSARASLRHTRGPAAPIRERRPHPRMQMPHQMETPDPDTYDPEKPGLGQLAGNRPEGSHSTGFRFLPTNSMGRDSSPALLCIAGMYPGLSAEDVTRPEALPIPPQGKWNYYVLTGETCSNFVTVPGSELLDSHPDTVAVVASSTSVGLDLPDGQEHEVLAMVDRSDPAINDPNWFDEKAFYVWEDDAGTVHIRWHDAVPSGWRILGRVLYVQMPSVKNPKRGRGFAETDDDFEF